MYILIIEMLWTFIIYSILGWCSEVIYATVKTGKYINRGFLGGTWCPLYGTGAVSVILLIELLSPYYKATTNIDNNFAIFIICAVTCTVIEYITGFILEKIFGLRWWDYSSKPFNVKGYICIEFTLVWGLGGLIAINTIFDTTSSIIQSMTGIVYNIALAFLLVVFLIDVVMSVIAMTRLANKIKVTKAVSNRIKKTSNIIGAQLSETTLKAIDKTASTKAYTGLSEIPVKVGEFSNRTENRLLKAFPSLEQGRYSELYVYNREKYRLLKPDHEKTVPLEIYANAYLNLLKQKNEKKYNDTLRLTEYATRFVKALRLLPSEDELVITSVKFHNIGYIISNKHSNIAGFNILTNIKQLEIFGIILYFQDEHYDGSGEYSIKEKQIPFSSQIILCLKHLDDCLNKNMTKENIIYDLKELRGTIINPNIIDNLIDNYDKIVIK